MEIRYVQKEDFRFGNLRGLFALVQKEVKRYAEVYMQAIIAPVITTLLFYVVFALAFGGLERHIGDLPFLDFLAPGLIMMSMVQNAFANSSSSLMISKMQGNIVDLLLSPLSPLELYLGYAIGAVSRGMLVGVCTWLAMACFISVSIASLPIAILYGLLGTLMLGNLGVLAGVWAEKFDHVAAITNFIVTPLSFLSGTFYTMDSLPQMWQFIASFNPFYYMIDGFRAGFIGFGETSILLGVAILVGINVLLAGAIVFMLRTGYKIKT